MFKVLAITPTYYPDVGGGALASHLIVNLLANVRGLRLTVLTGIKNPKRVKGVSYYYDPFLKLMNKQYIPQSWLSARYQNIIDKHDVIYITYALSLIHI